MLLAKDIEDIEAKLNSFHLVFHGLENDNFSATELIDEVHNEMKNYFRIGKDDLLVLDELSVISKSI
jgi:hypothetical protein